MRIFISSTFKDLKEYRATVSEMLKKMQEPDAAMETFGSSPNDPTSESLNQLEKCDVYIGIIGHRFGSTGQDSTKSIVQEEYERALSLHKQGRMTILLYLSDSSAVRLLPEHRENDDLARKQEEFRSKLERRHTLTYFRNPQELAILVAADLYKNRHLAPTAEPAVTIFESTDWPEISSRFESGSRHKNEKIFEFIEFLASQFNNLFKIDSVRDIRHPLLYQAENRLNDILPGIALDDVEGILMRTGVRHVILRTETARTMLQAIARSESSLRSVGEQIGNTAAKDLIKNTIIEGKLIPASAAAFMTLWNYWDRTGGWGDLALLDDHPKRNEAKGIGPEWKIRLRNNFLADHDLAGTHLLCEFWCGYIKGVLGYALPRITEVMIEKVDQESRLKVTLPAFHRVKSVVHLEDNSLSEDIFSIRFRKEKFSTARQNLSEAHRLLKKGEIRASELFLLYSVESAKKTLDSAFEKTLESLNFSQDIKQAMNEIISAGPSDGHPDEERIQSWFRVANTVIQRLSETENDDE